jgi:branched-chain amino acid aminotransferase
MELSITRVEPSRMKPKPKDDASLGFGKYFSDHMFVMRYAQGRWREPSIVPYASFEMDPAAMVFHYGQAIFEGMKAYRGKDGGIYLFRPGANMDRMNNSAAKLCMPEFDGDFVLNAMKELVNLDRDWIPRTRGSALYIRPTMMADEPALGVRPSATYIFFIIVGPVGAYYPEGFNPVKIYVSDEHVRAVRGGVGEAKTAANYAASLFAAEKAKKAGFTQVLWLDAVERRYVEEVGTMNIFFLMGDELITPPLRGSILPGVTRDSVIRVARDMGCMVVERNITVDEVVEGCKSGTLKEVFGTGTAAVISPVGEISYKGRAHTVGDGKTGPLATKLFDYLLRLQYAEIEDPYGWVEKIG